VSFRGVCPGKKGRDQRGGSVAGKGGKRGVFKGERTGGLKKKQKGRTIWDLFYQGLQHEKGKKNQCGGMEKIIRKKVQKREA